MRYRFCVALSIVALSFTGTPAAIPRGQAGVAAPPQLMAYGHWCRPLCIDRSPLSQRSDS